MDEDITEKEQSLKKKLKFIGHDLEQIPCFRNSFLYGISSGIGVGLATFAFTSKARNATHAGFFSYMGVTLCYWFYCRYRYSVTKFEYEKLKFVMQNYVEKQGTDEFDKIKNSSGNQTDESNVKESSKNVAGS